MKFVLGQSQFPRVRLSLVSCAFVLIVTYAAWHNQQRARTVLGPIPVTAPELAPGSQIAAVPQSVLDPRPGWVGATVPQLQPALVPKEEQTAAEARPTPESQEGARVALAPKDEQTAAEARSTPESQEGARAAEARSTPESQEGARAAEARSTPESQGGARAALAPKGEQTAAEARPTPESQEGAKAEVIGSSPMIRELITRTGATEITPIPLPRPRPRKPPAIVAPKAVGAPLKIN
jgi:cell division protein FtsN